MSKSSVITKPVLSGTVAANGPFSSLFMRAGWRVYPYQAGCLVRADNNGGSYILTHGMGEFDQNDYLIVCRETYYGDVPLYIPDMNKITKVTSFGPGSAATQAAATDDRLNISPAITVNEGDFLLCLGADGAATPTSAPNYDGSDITIYDDNVGNNASSLNYLSTGSSGLFHGWLESGFDVVSLLITDESGTPKAAVPFYPTGPDVVVV